MIFVHSLTLYSHLYEACINHEITGQDGACLVKLLWSEYYEVHGNKRRSFLINTKRIDNLYQNPHEEHVRFILHYENLSDSTNLIRIE